MFNLDEAPVIALSLEDIPVKAQEMAGKMSISGMQPKLSMLLNRQKRELVACASDGHYILKPQTQQFPHLPENENCCMNIAGELGIDVPPHCLLFLKDGSPAYVVKRFDRRESEKIHQEDFYQILEKKDKYDGSLEQIGKKLREISSVPGLDVQLFFERAVFNFLIGNGDGHFKNFSISYSQDGAIRLAPAYDIVCSKLVIPGEKDSALTLNGKKNKLTRSDFDALAETLKIHEKIRYEKFRGEFKRIRQEAEASRLPDAFRGKFIEIAKERFNRMRL